MAWANSQSLCPGWSESSKSFMNNFLWYNNAQRALWGRWAAVSEPWGRPSFGSDSSRFRGIPEGHGQDWPPHYALARIGSAGICAILNRLEVIRTAVRLESL